MSDDEESRPSDEQMALSVQLHAWNDSPSSDAPLIDSLPPELLVRILEEVYLAHQRSGTHWAPSPWTIPYQLVCRRWRDVISSTPSLWQRINVYAGAESLEFYLTRCAGALATVHVWDPSSPDKTFATLRCHAWHIRAYHVHCDVPELDYLSGLPLLLATPMPALEALSLDGPYREDQTLDVPITHDLAPRLTALNLRNSKSPRDIAMYTPLRSLTLSGSQWTISYDEFLDVMSKCRDLECLNLDEEVLDPFSDELANPTTGHPPRMTPVVLPRLKVLELRGQVALLFHLLATLHAPQATTIELMNRLDDDEPGPLVTRLLAPNPQLRYPFLSSPRAVSVSCWDGAPFRLSVRCGPDSNALLSIDYGMRHDLPANSYLEPNLVDIMDFFSVVSVDTLEVEGDLDKVAVETWQRIFEAFQNLRTLLIKGRGTFDSLWLGLQRATTSSVERDGVVCCPFLSEIVVDDPPWRVSSFEFEATATVFGLIPGVLGARADAGGARLQKLQLYLHYTDELWSQMSELRDAFVEDVKALVEELDYRDGRT
ncbi:hypothetical protein LXA43DRAFT_459073 [Ganoderma leucocontextum]|nr:hypothetical protein LXA43DRAFT_459073 [Ganoderma leucocontextum]